MVERLGRGGMAEIYRAFQLNLEREVANSYAWVSHR